VQATLCQPLIKRRKPTLVPIEEISAIEVDGLAGGRERIPRAERFEMLTRAGLNRIASPSRRMTSEGRSLRTNRRSEIISWSRLPGMSRMASLTDPPLSIRSAR
jgi:hypothetical protein